MVEWGPRRLRSWCMTFAMEIWKGPLISYAHIPWIVHHIYFPTGTFSFSSIGGVLYVICSPQKIVFPLFSQSRKLHYELLLHYIHKCIKVCLPLLTLISCSLTSAEEEYFVSLLKTAYIIIHWPNHRRWWWKRRSNSFLNDAPSFLWKIRIYTANDDDGNKKVLPTEWSRLYCCR